MSLPPQELPWHDLDPGSLRGTRIGLALDAGAGMPVDPEIAGVAAAAAGALEGFGLVVEPTRPLIDPPMLSGLDRFWRMRSLQDWMALPPERRDRVLPYLRAWMEPAGELSAADVFAGFSQMNAMSVSVRDVMGEFDFILSPVAPIATFSADLPSPTGDPGRALEHIGFTVPFSMSGHPAISVPWSTSVDGRPVGVQIVGRRFADVDVLRLAALCELLRPPLPAWPQVSSSTGAEG